MPNPPVRRFTLADTMILVAAIALGIAGARTIHENNYARISDHVAPFLASWTPASIAIRFRKPRPRLGLVFRQPGMVAACVATFVLATEAVFLIGSALIGKYVVKQAYIGIDLGNYLLLCLNSTGQGVAAAWIALTMAGRWRPEPGWVDRQGRTLGVGWIALWVLSELGL